MAKVTVLTPSFNKLDYVTDAILSVLNQTHKDIDYMIIENSTDQKVRDKVIDLSKTDSRIRLFLEDFTEEERKVEYITAKLNNKYYPQALGKYIIFLSDDDLLYPTCLEKQVRFMEENSLSASYHSQAISRITPEGGWDFFSEMKAIHERGKNTQNPQVDCMLDGGQLMHTKAILDLIEQPYFPTDMDSAAHCDGMFMEKIAKHATFHPLITTELLSEHRRTNLSTWVKPTD